MATIPTHTEILDHLENYNIDGNIVSQEWIEGERDTMVIPFVNSVVGMDVQTAQSVTEYHSGNGNTLLFLNRRNITAITGIEIVRGEPFLTRIDLASVDLIPGEGILKAKKNLNEGLYFTIFPKGDMNIKVTYTYGGVLNDDIATAIKKLSCIAILDHIEGMTGGGSLSVQAFSRDYGNMGKYSNVRKRLNKQAMFLLRKYSTAVIGA